MNFESCLESLLATLKLDSNTDCKAIVVSVTALAQRATWQAHRMTWLEAELAHMRKVAKGQESEIATLKEQLQESEIEKGMLEAAKNQYHRELGEALEVKYQLASERERAERLLDKLQIALSQRETLAAELAVERKKWPEMKAEVETLRKEASAAKMLFNLLCDVLNEKSSASWVRCDLETGAKVTLPIDIIGRVSKLRVDQAEVERLKKLVNAHEATISLFGQIIKNRGSAKTGLHNLTTGATAHIAPDVREALDTLVQDAAANGPYVSQLRERVQSLEMLVSNGTKDFNDQVRKTAMLARERDDQRAQTEILAWRAKKAEEQVSQLRLELHAAKHVQVVAAPAPAATPITRDQVRLALLDFPDGTVLQVNRLADHLIKRLS